MEPGDRVTAPEVVVLVAMAEEADAFLSIADSASEPTSVAGALHRTLVLDGREVLLVQTGIGLVHAASAASVVLAGSRPRLLVSAGTAGGLGADVRVADVVVASSCVHAGVDVRAFGYLLGQVPGMPESFPGDAGAVAAAATPEVAGAVDSRVLVGTTLSSDAFVDEHRVESVRETFPDALATDMESAALAQTAHLFGVPFVSVRGVSDLCLPVPGSGWATHVDDASDRSAAVVVALLRALLPAA